MTSLCCVMLLALCGQCIAHGLRDVLVDDFCALRSLGYQADVSVPFEGGPFKMMEREIKNRIEAALKLAAWTEIVPVYGQIRSAPISNDVLSHTDIPLHLQEALLEWWKLIVPPSHPSSHSYTTGALSPSSPVFRWFNGVSTRLTTLYTDLASVSSEEDDRKLAWQKFTAAGVGCIGELLQSLTLREQSLADAWYRESPTFQDCIHDDTVACLFNATCLPSLQDLHDVFPWLHPDVMKQAASPPPSHDFWNPSLADLTRLASVDAKREGVFGERLEKAEAPIIPPEWVYLYSNEARRSCEIWNKEYISGLTWYLVSRAEHYVSGNAVSDSEPLRILEVGAGDGRLSFFLKQEIRRAHPEWAARLSFTATDAQGSHWTHRASALPSDVSYGNIAESTKGSNPQPLSPCSEEWRGASGLAAFPVGRASAEKSIDDTQPHIVLSSWMTRGQDWTRAMRAAASVQEYILIGEADFGVSGLPWATWGVGRPNSDTGGLQAPSSGSQLGSCEQGTADSCVIGDEEPIVDDQKLSPPSVQLPPFRQDGFERVDLDDISILQVCRSDSPILLFHCRTISFRRSTH
eukprot:Rmarinus@m.2768